MCPLEQASTVHPADEPQYDMPPFQGRNILVFSDGTGQAGGLQLDEFRTNVYKLYRATRCGPDCDINPNRQLAIYDPGLGSKLAGENIRLGFLRRWYNKLSSATGLGLTGNIIDCYAALLKYWRPGDRIFLFGFSRGAYTVRCLGGVLGLCGIPIVENGKPISRDDATLRRIATEAVKRVYSHGTGTSDADQSGAGRVRHQKLKAQREALGRQFRSHYGSEGPLGANVVPHFIGVWDTVAAVGLTPPAARILGWSAAGAFVLISLALLCAGTSIAELAAMLAVIGCAGLGFYYLMRLRWVTGLPDYKWYQTLHLTSLKMTFFDRSLNPNVRYARHAIAIDENRADFDRVPWKNDGDPPDREIAEGAWFRQMWFAGNHSDIGGSYPENESRLSDIALDWMAREAVKAGMLVDRRYLNLFGHHSGVQHDECRAGISLWGFRFKWREQSRNPIAGAILHPSVKARFEESAVSIYGEDRLYRPAALKQHMALRDFYHQPEAGDHPGWRVAENVSNDPSSRN